MKKLIACFLTVSLVLASSSCKRNTDEGGDDNGKKSIVSVKGETLFRSELEDALPVGISGGDSVAMAKAYIEMWVENQLIYDKAQQNILSKEDIESLVEDYRKTLIINSYQEQLLQEQFSKSVSENELKAYYEQNKDKFTLDENIIKGLYLKIPKESSQLDNFLKWYKQGTEAAMENIEKNYLQNTVSYNYFYDRWTNLDNITENMPLSIADEKQFLRANKNFEARDSSFVYLLNIKEYVLSGNEAPYEYVKPNLINIYMEQKKAGYLKQVKKDLYDKAVSEGEIKFYE